MALGNTVGVKTVRFRFGLLIFFGAFLVLSTASAYAQVGLSINDVSQAEGDPSTTTFVFSVALDAPAPPGGVTFDIATAGDTATAGIDYTERSLTGQTIPAGSSIYSFSVNVTGDNVAEANETFFVNVTNVTNANVIDGQGVGTILNDDLIVTPIHDVQGPGASSPIPAVTVTIRGIVTGVKANGFFVQEEDAEVDADPATSEAVFVATAGTPPPAAAFSALVQVTGTVSEFVPITDPFQPPSTRLTFPTVLQVAPPGQALPTAVTLTATFPDPNGPFDQLERVEHMRVSVASLTVTGPSRGTVDESAATGTSDGRFHGVLTGLARPFRESGIQAPDPPPSGSIPPIPRWDFNPERIGVDSAAMVGQPVLTVRSGDIVTSLAGPLDYSLRTYTVVPDGTSTATIAPGALPTTVSPAVGNEITVASVNLRRFFDVTDDSSVADIVLMPAAYDRRLAKASMAIGSHLRNPDIIGVQEVETLGVLIDLAARISADGGPAYDPFLVPGNDPAGLDVGFLVKIDPVTAGVPRVSNISSTQVGVAETWIDPATGAPALLNDRPSLVLEATVNRAVMSGLSSFPIVVIVSDLAGLDGIESLMAAGSTTVGNRVRRKRQARAESLANYVQGRLTANPGEHLILIGSHNAFEVNDGHVDVINVISGTPSPDNQTSVTGDGVDLVNPDLVNLVATPPPAERYSEVFDGTARNLDHALVSAGLVAATIARRIEHPRIAADYPEIELGNTTALRFSDRDPVVAYLATPALNLADMTVTKIGTPNPVTVGQNVTYTLTAVNNGPDAAASVTLSDTLPPGMSFVSFTSPAGWSCSTPAVGAGGTVTCSIPNSGVGSAVFTLVATVAPAVIPGTILTNSVSVSSVTADTAPANNSATATTTVAGAADLSITKTGPPTILSGGSIAYTLTVVNAGPSSAAAVSIDDPTPAGLTFLSASGACVTTFPCALGTLAPGESRSITATFRVPPGYAGASPIVNVATASASTLDPSPANNSASAGTLVISTGSGCDVNGDGQPAFITGAGGASHVRVWSVETGRVTELFGQGFFAYNPAFAGGVRVACRDVTGDGIAEIITGAGPGGGPHVRVWSVAGGSLSEVAGFFAYNPAFPGGVAVAAGDLTGDGVAELVTGAGPGGGPHVRVWSVAGGSLSELAGFFAYNPAFAGGVAVATGDLTGDGVGELITGAGPGGGPHVRVWSVAGGSVSELDGFFAYHPAFPGGVAVAAGDLTGDGVAEIVTGAGPGGGPHVRVWSLTTAARSRLRGSSPTIPHSLAASRSRLETSPATASPS